MGAGMLLLFITHHILNGYWHRSLFKGKYNTLRFLTLCIDILVLVSVLAQMYSGIVMSRYVFDFLPSIGGMSLARRLHILGAYWGFLLMNLHLGLHWNMILGMSRKGIDIRNKSKIRSTIALLAGSVVAGYGVQSFIRRDFPIYLLLKSEFVFFDYSESKILFTIDYLSLMGLCIFIAHYCAKIIRRLRKKL